MNKATPSFLYRAVSAGTDVSCLKELHKTMRQPINVPYIVDNLWEWQRPDGYPNRRFSIFASPTSDLAIASAGEGKIPYRVELMGRFKLCQMKCSSAFKDNNDSKYHPDCRKLREKMLKKLDPTWLDVDLDQKTKIGRLWMPCLRKEEVAFLFESEDVLRKIRDEIADNITYWNDAILVKDADSLPDKNGEVFFEPLDGYWLRPLP